MWWRGPVVLYDWLVDAPLRSLYFRGLVWAGMAPEDCCAYLTSVPAAWWCNAKFPERIDECQELLDRRYDTVRITVMFAAYILVVTTLAGIIVCRCCFLNPILRALRPKS